MQQILVFLLVLSCSSKSAKVESYSTKVISEAVEPSIKNSHPMPEQMLEYLNDPNRSDEVETCYDPSLQDADLDEAFCASSMSQGFPVKVTVEIVTRSDLDRWSKQGKEAEWSQPIEVGTVTFAYENHPVMRQMSAIKIHDRWWYMWGESRWFIQVEPREDGRTCEAVDVVEQGMVLFCSHDAGQVNLAVDLLRANIKKVAKQKR